MHHRMESGTHPSKGVGVSGDPKAHEPDQTQPPACRLMGLRYRHAFTIHQTVREPAVCSGTYGVTPVYGLSSTLV